MTGELQQLVRQTMQATGASPPDLFEADSPVLDDAVVTTAGDGLYFVGLIGGKDVGKSALINAIVACPITEVASTGAGTEIVVAYAHRSREHAVRELLEREAPGQFRIVAHDLDRLSRQVLLDLPDIDSHYTSHLELTRKMLRQMLFPVWVASVEKYADQQPRQMLSRVAEGNSPENFVFVLNKADQLISEGSDRPRSEPARYRGVTPWGIELHDDDEHGRSPAQVQAAPASAAASELQADYADRIAKALKLGKSPRVYLISAQQSERFDGPELLALLSRQKSADQVRTSRASASSRQDQALLRWLDAQNLPHKAARLAAVESNARQVLSNTVAGPLLQTVVWRLADDPASAAALADDVLQERAARWPIVNLVHTLLQPLFVLLRSAVTRGPLPRQGAAALVEAAIQETGQSPSCLVQSGFAELRRTHSELASIYTSRRLWEQMSADHAAGELSAALANALERRQELALARLSRGGWIFAPLRWLLTIGAMIWFPFLQPILSLQPDVANWRSNLPILGANVIRVLGVDYLLKTAAFLIIYYVALWLALRWNTARKVSSLMQRWRDKGPADPAASLDDQTMQWIDNLLMPIVAERDRYQSLADRAADMKKRLGGQ